MTVATILTLVNGRGIDLLAPTLADIDLAAFAEHVAKEKRFNGATPDVEYSVADHLSIGSDAILAAGGTETEAAYFHVHDLHEAIWKDDPTPKKVAIATRIAERCGVLAADILAELDGIVRDHDAVIHQAAGLPYPLPEDIKRIVKHYDIVMFVTEWRDLMHGVAHPNWAPYADVKPLAKKIVPQTWAHARAGWLYRAKRLLPSQRVLAHNKKSSEHAGTSE